MWHGQPQSEVWRPWRRIDEMLNESSLSVGEFEERYMRHHTPLVFRGWATSSKRPALARWTLKRLRDRCGDATVSFSERYIAFLQTVSDTERRSIDRRLQEVDGVTLSQVLARLTRDMTLREYIDYVLGMEERGVPGTGNQSRDGQLPAPSKDFSHIADLLLPLTSQEMPLRTVCPEMYRDLVVSKYFGGHKLNSPWANERRTRAGEADQEADNPERCWLHPDPVVYIAPPHSRAYPTHVHGKMDENMLIVLDGEKHFVGWHYDQRHALRRMDTAARTDSGPIGDEVFEAEGIYYDFARQPDLRGAVGYEAYLRRGDMLYLPCGSAHQVQNQRATLAVRVAALNADALRCTKWMYEQGWGGVTRSWLDKHEMLLSLDTKVAHPRDESVSEYCGLVRDAAGREDESDVARDDGGNPAESEGGRRQHASELCPEL